MRTLYAVIAATLMTAVQHPASAQVLGEAARRSDVAQFRSAFLERDRAYSPAARRLAEQRLALLDAEPGDMDATRFVLQLAQIAALADNGHSAVLADPRSARTNRVEIRLAPFGRHFHVLRARSDDADLLGARLESIDTRPLAQLREAAHALSGGLPAWRDLQAPLLFESPQQLHALGLTRAADAAVYRFISADGRTLERRLVAEPPRPDRPRAYVPRLLLPGVTPEQHEGADTGWRSLLPLAQAPWSLRDAEQALRWRAAPELDAVLIDLRQTRSDARHRLPDFFAAVRAGIAQHRPRNLVLDLRLNGGGDLTQARDFAEGLPALVEGTVFVLTSPGTFSAAISLAGYVKQAAPRRVRIVGEAVGDRLEFFAEGRTLTLTHSGAVVLPATERHDYRTGCQAKPDCHAPVVQRPIAVPHLDPDFEAPWTLAAYRSGADPAMEAVAAALRRGP